jgi:hypothetical protein
VVQPQRAALGEGVDELLLGQDAELPELVVAWRSSARVLAFRPGVGSVVTIWSPICSDTAARPSGASMSSAWPSSWSRRNRASIAWMSSGSVAPARAASAALDGHGVVNNGALGDRPIVV